MKSFIVIILLLTIEAFCSFGLLAQQTNERLSASIAKNEVSTDEIIINAYDNRIVVENAPVGSKIEIYSVVGIRVKEIIVKQPSAEYTLDIAKGYYIIRIGETVRKIAIR